VNKYALSILLLLVFAQVMGQKKSRVVLVDSKKLEMYKGPKGKNIWKVTNGTFQQDYSTLRADSTLFYPDQNAFDAFGHVNINQGDTLNIFSDKLNYNGNTKVAILTNNVKMVDRSATLTTNYFTYNTATRVGNYTGGGKLVDKDNTLTSKNGFYFSGSRDAYFRYNVICTTPDAIIKTDTMRYNSGTRITYFYGATHIYGKKDKDTLYTENGTYDTNIEQAFFVKNNLYKQGSKSLKGDTLFYDRIKGYGRATRNVTFNDDEQRITIKGGIGEYFKADDRAMITRRPYMIFVTEEKDTTQTKTDTLTKTKSKPNAATVKLLGLDTKPKPDSATVKLLGLDKINSNTKAAANNKADSLAKKPIAKAPEKIKRDSLYMGADTLETRVITFKEQKELQRERWLAANRDTSIKAKPHIVYKTKAKSLSVTPPKMPDDTTYLHRDLFGKPKPPVTAAAKKPAPVKAAPKLTAKDSLRIKQKEDSLELIANHGLRDTSRIRIVYAYHNAKLFKSDLQAIADSMFYSSSDSTIRNYGNPMMWTQGSQLSGDTIHIQMKNKKLDNMDLFLKGFIVNIEKNDSLHFNQLSGKKIHGTFDDNKLKTLVVTGNAESRYFKRDTITNEVTDMLRSQSGSLNAYFNKGKVTTGAFIQNPDIKTTPIGMVKDEDKLLKNFLWKPKDRPASKEAIVPPHSKANAPAKKATPTKTTAVKKPAGKPLQKLKTPLPPAAKTDTTLTHKPTGSNKIKADTITKRKKN
jgi:lipopolysaccharide export system protein LptA